MTYIVDNLTELRERYLNQIARIKDLERQGATNVVPSPARLALQTVVRDLDEILPEGEINEVV